MNEIHLITMEVEDGCCFPPNFTPEAYTQSNKAYARYTHLQDRKGEFAGYYYTIQSLEVDPFDK